MTAGPEVSTAAPGPAGGPGETRRAGELSARELLRWAWRQLTSMRTALVLLLLVALAAVPGSVVPQEGVDSLAASRWRDEHPRLTPVYEWLGLFSVYDSVWFSAIYLLLMTSLVGCFLPRIRVYWRAFRAGPPPAPRNLDRLPDHTSYVVGEPPAQVLDEAERVLRRRRFRVARGQDTVAAERGYLREGGNLLFHVSVLVVLVGFAVGGLFGYQGGVIVLVGGGFSNNLVKYDDLDPGRLFDPTRMEPFSLTIDDFDVEWIENGPAQGMARKFVSSLTYRERPDGPEQTYDLRVNHPLSIGGTDLFLIGHGYAPVISVRDGNGDVVLSEPVIFLPENPSFLSFGVVKAPDARPTQIGLEGLFYPSYVLIDGDPVNVMGDWRNPTLSLLAYTGDLGLDDGVPQSVYVLDKRDLDLVEEDDGSMFRVDLQPGQTLELPDGAGSVTFEGVQRWNRIQISRTPGKEVALAGVVLALVGVCLSLFVRPRRLWVRVRRDDDGGSLVEAAALDRSGNADVSEELDAVSQALGRLPERRQEEDG